MSDEKPPWRKAIEDYERTIGAPLEEFIKSDQFADMAAKAAKQGTQMPQIPQMPQGPGGASTTAWMHSMNLPAASDIDDLRAEIQALHDDVRALTELIAHEREQPEATPPGEAEPPAKAKSAPKAEAKPKANAEAKPKAKAQPAPKAKTKPTPE